MKVWVVGSKGMLGSCFLTFLKEKKIVCIGSDKILADITSFDSLNEFIKKNEGISHVVNCAAYTKVDFAEKEQKDAFEINVKGPENLARVAEKFSMKVVHFSTDYVFSGDQNTPYKEEDFCFPLSVYGKTKYEGERKILEKKGNCVIRTSWLFGEGKEHFISKILGKMQEKEKIEVVSDTWGKLTFTNDLVKAAFALFSEEGIFHFANSEAVSWYQIASYVQKKARQLKLPMICKEIVPISGKEYVALAKRPSYSVLDTKKIEKILKKAPRCWKEAVDEYMGKIL